MHRSLYILSGTLAAVSFSLTGAASAQAQASGAKSESATAAILDILARERAMQWASSKPTIRCAPAPLVEQPGAAGRESRPAVLPLEAAFLDAASVRHMLLAREPEPLAQR